MRRRRARVARVREQRLPGARRRSGDRRTRRATRAARWGVGAGASHLVCGHTERRTTTLERELAAFVAPCAERARAHVLVRLSREPRDPDRARRPRRRGVRATGSTTRASTTARCCRGAARPLRARRHATRSRSALAASTRARASSSRPTRCSAWTATSRRCRDLLALAEAHDAWLVVDDAHGFGVLGDGRGSLAHFGLASERIVYMGTLGKAAGVAGAFVAAHPAVIETLVQTARPYIYTTAAPALLAEALRAALAQHPRRRCAAPPPARADRALSREARARCRGARCRRHADPAAGRRRTGATAVALSERCGAAASGCRRSGRRPCRTGPRDCASACPPRTRRRRRRAARGAARMLAR